ncbi:MAG: DUF58 domain-containing protein [Candidatus Omnitrophica bacterium]|nr:DUF58 domain-containing protein [Candidatus Omnitrophota bacterium]
MIPKEILENVRRIEITTNRLVTDVFGGQYQSVFKGRGIEFDEVREYQPGDDVRSIDWNVTARTGIPHIKKFVEEREMTVMVLVDASRSCRFASVRQLKSRLAAEVAAVLAFSAIRNHDKIGLIFFTNEVEKFIPPRKGRSHVLRLIREILCFEPKGKGTDIAAAMEFMGRVTTRKAVTFIISDFFEPAVFLSNGPAGGEPRYLKALAVANKRHDVIAVTLNDPREMELPDCGLLELEDAETGRSYTVDSSDAGLRQEYKTRGLGRVERRTHAFRSLNMDHIDISTAGSFADHLVKFFAMRQKRAR